MLRELEVPWSSANKYFTVIYFLCLAVTIHSTPECCIILISVALGCASVNTKSMSDIGANSTIAAQLNLEWPAANRNLSRVLDDNGLDFDLSKIII